MNYESIESIYAANEAVRRKLYARVENLSDAQQTFRPTDDAWSIAEIMEHLSIIETNMVRLIGMLLAKTESAAATVNTGAGAQDAGADASAGDATATPSPRAFQPFSMDALIDTIKDKKLDAPEQVRPGGQMALADSLAALRATRASLESLRPRLEAADLTAAAYPHPAWGDLNIAQWLAFIGLHEGRHLAQIKRLMEAPDFVGANET
ncbi:MAG TPA: DinB family protein [Pyrinomonadaceae bacterium]|nr:DinB family protein [Pyrinomonadaceae bacterium]